MKKYYLDWYTYEYNPNSKKFEKKVSHTEEISSANEYWDKMKLRFCEETGIYVYKQTLKTLTWYSYFGSEGFYKVHKNIETGKETRTHMKWIKCPKHLRTSEGWTKYNYYCG